MNPSLCPIAVKPQEFLKPGAAGLDGARSQPPHSAGGFVPVKEFRAVRYAAQKMLAQFARPNLTFPTKVYRAWISAQLIDKSDFMTIFLST
jgi:hypothetical protein